MKSYVDLTGQSFDLATLDADEQRLLRRFRRLAASAPTAVYRNGAMHELAEFYAERGLTRSRVVQTPLYRIIQDIGARREVERGEARSPDYRDQIEELIRSHYPTRRAFCRATGLSEEMLSHVLARRKHLSIERLTEALEKIGYSVTIAPLRKSG